MIKRPVGKAPGVSITNISGDDTGKHNRHGTPLNSISRWIRRNLLSVVLISLLAACTILYTLAPPTTSSIKATAIAEPIPQCETSPWKPHEDLRGQCPGDLKPFASAATISTCATSCCTNPKCITWQFRADTGCLQGGDVRLGMEKDGVSAWCSDHPPKRWQGQYLYKPGGKEEEHAEIRKRGCDASTWNPSEQVGQCFGLGDVKKHASGSPEECREACCSSDKCRAWQWNEDLGCFYSSHMHGCQGEGDAVKFDPFVGRRKFLQDRSYTDNAGKPWVMTL